MIVPPDWVHRDQLPARGDEGGEGLQRQSRDRKQDQRGKKHPAVGQDELPAFRGERGEAQDGCDRIQSSSHAPQVLHPWRGCEAVHRMADSEVDQGGGIRFLPQQEVACTRIHGFSFGASLPGGF